MVRWTRAQVEKLAPDERSVKAARSLAKPGPWSDLGATKSLAWGKCQGSGKSPYQVSVDLNGPAFKCTCPSRKFPCKHGLALLMLWAEADGVVADMAAPADFASEWAEGRAQRAVKKSEKALPDPEAQARRLEERLAKMDQGAAEFEQWLLDLAGQGLASARTQPPEFWERTAARLVDSQLPGLADRVRVAAAGLAADGWLELLLGEVSRWHLAVQGWKRRDSLPEALFGDLRTYLGWSRAQAEVLENGVRLTGPWTVLGVSQDLTERILAQRTWLRSSDGTHAVMLDFSTAAGSLRVANVVGSVIDCALAAYPGSEPARVVFATEPQVTGSVSGLPGGSTVSDNLDRAAVWVAANPFAGPLPMTLASVIPQVGDGRLELVDSEGAAVRVTEAFVPWDLVIHAASGPVDAFGEWDGTRFRPLAVSRDEQLVAL